MYLNTAVYGFKLALARPWKLVQFYLALRAYECPYLNILKTSNWNSY